MPEGAGEGGGELARIAVSHRKRDLRDALVGGLEQSGSMFETILASVRHGRDSESLDESLFERRNAHACRARRIVQCHDAFKIGLQKPHAAFE